MVDLIQGLDGDRPAQQKQFYDLEDLASVLRWSVVALTDLASRTKNPLDSLELTKVCVCTADSRTGKGSQPCE